MPHGAPALALVRGSGEKKGTMRPPSRALLVLVLDEGDRPGCDRGSLSGRDRLLFLCVCCGFPSLSLLSLSPMSLSSFCRVNACLRPMIATITGVRSACARLTVAVYRSPIAPPALSCSTACNSSHAIYFSKEQGCCGRVGDTTGALFRRACNARGTSRQAGEGGEVPKHG